MRNNLLYILLAGSLLIAGLFAYSANSKAPASQSPQPFALAGWQNGAREPSLGVVEIHEVIMDTAALVETIDAWRTDDNVRGLILSIDSPGGAVAPSQEAYDAVMRFRQVKPTTAVIGSLGASGGYYIASAAESIWVMRGSLAGSIGVIMEMFDASDLAEKVGVKATTIKTGIYKDTGNPFRRMTTDEVEYLHSIAMETYAQFITDVLAGRPKLTLETLKPYADGRIYLGPRAIEIGLADKLGNFAQAVSTMAGQTGLPTEDTPLIYPHQGWEGRLEDILQRFDSGAAHTPLGSILAPALELQRLGVPILALWPGALTR